MELLVDTFVRTPERTNYIRDHSMMPLFCTGPRIYKAPSLTSLSPSKQHTVL